LSLAATSFLELIAIYMFLGWAIYLVYRAGQIYNAPIFTMIIGAYSSAYVVRDLSWPFGLAIVLAVTLGGIGAFIPALGLARPQVPAFATVIATIALIFIGQTVVKNLEFLGGTHGFFQIPTVGYLLPLMYVALVLVGVFIYRLDHSRIGRSMETVFVSPDLAASLGVDVYKMRIFLQVSAGALGALAGVFYAFTVGAIQVPAFGLSLLLVVFCFLFVGGYTTMWGVVVFTPALWAISVFLPEGVSAWKDIIYGSLVMLVLILRPHGVIDKQVLRLFRINGQRWSRTFKCVKPAR